MSQQELINEIGSSVNRILMERGLKATQVTAVTRLVGEEDLPIDSLDLAVIVTDLQEKSGRDPFKAGFQSFTTAGELAKLFDAH